MSFFFRGNSDWPPFQTTNGEGQALPINPGPLIKWGVIIGGLILLFVILNVLRGIYTNWLWFDNLGYKSVYLKMLTTRVWLFFAGALVFAALIAPSVVFAYRQSSGDPIVPIAPDVFALLRKLFVWGIGLGVFFLAIIFGSVAGGQWETMLRFINEVPFTTVDPTSGQTVLAEDPVFHKNISFYVFTIPVLNLVQGWLLGAVIVIMLATAAVYLINLSLRGVNLAVALTSQMIAHTSVLLGVLLLVITWGYWIDIYELLFSSSGAIFGAAYTDLNARLPALRFLMAVGSATGLLLLANARFRSIRIILGGFGLWVAVAIIVGAVYPALVQRFQVDPDELSRERKYIPRNIEFTRQGFALDRIEEQDYPFSPSLTPEVVATNPETIENVRLWDHRPLRNVYNQKQFFRAYYRFVDVDVDRYVVDGQYRQVILAARELFSEDLPEGSQSWVNSRLQFTHGYGIAMSPVTEFTPEGQPHYFIKNIPPQVGDGIAESGVLDVTQPQVYYGENTGRYVIVNSKEPEFDYPAIETNVPVRTSYQGAGGVQLSSLVRRFAYAWEFADINILISSAISSEARIQYRRDVQDRVAQIAPFLRLDSDPYLVVADGKLLWIQDAYTTTSYYPYSDPFRGDFNYIRNSVKAVVDAYNGTVDFYIFDEEDAIIQTYAKVFPDLFKPQDAMPEALQAHIRYPQDFFSVQAEKYLLYHMRDTTDFYNKEDPWSVPNELFFEAEQPMEPYYVIMKLPGEEKEEFVLLLPFTPLDKPNLVAWLAARSDNDRGQYGSLVSFLFPKGTPVDGPEQVEARIDNDFTIKQQFTLLCQRGARCIRGNLLVVPVVDPTSDPLKATLLYVEPLYIQAENIAFPELKQVIVADANRVAMQGDLTSALQSLLSGAPPAVTPPSDGGEPPPAGTPDVQQQVDALRERIAGLQQSLQDLEEALQQLLQSLEETQ
ncbi:MAG: UPF0182 family protein [Chloroflexi bacterium]|nr:UPF0182 family protein [Chloroflexota bacterium]